MDRNPNDPSTSPTGNPGSSGMYGTGGMTGTGGTTGTSGTTGSTGSTTGGPGSSGGTATPSRSDDMSSSGTAGGMHGSAEHAMDQAKDVAREKLGDARAQVGEAAEKARGWKQSMEHGLADRLQTGASKLRERARQMPAASGDAATASGTPAYAGAAGGAAGAAVADRAKSVEQNLARGMDATADWLRNGDLQTTVQEQARSNPARTLLIALGVGYLLGKTIKR